MLRMLVVQNESYTLSEAWCMDKSMDPKRAGMAKEVGGGNLSTTYVLRFSLGCVTTTVCADFRSDI